MTNVDQREAWNNESGAAWVRMQEQFDATLAPWLQVLADAAPVSDGMRVLDVGCGNGATTLDAAQRCAPTGLAVGVDLSEPMLARARELAGKAGISNVHFVAGDAQVDELAVDGQPYDVVTSRFGVMFFDDPVAAFANMARATRPGGRLAFAAWTGLADQEWVTLPGAAALEHLPLPELPKDGAPGMFAFADPDDTGAILRDAGWSDVVLERKDRKATLGGGSTVDHALEFVLATGPGRALFKDADPEAARQATEAIRAAFAARLTPRGVELDSVAWLVTARR